VAGTASAPEAGVSNKYPKAHPTFPAIVDRSPRGERRAKNRRDGRSSMAYSAWMGNLLVQDVLGNYGTVKVLLDESSLPNPPMTLRVQVEIARQELSAADFEVEIFTNLNRREFVKLVEPLADSGNTTSSYWVTHPMHHVGQAYGNLVYAADVPITQCGAYRLTTRYRRRGSALWWWHNEFSPFDGAIRHRDCSVVVSPAKVAQLAIYEANALTIEALQGGSYQNRSTLDDFLPGADFDEFNPFDLAHVRTTLSFNALWLMPIFPNTRWRWDPNLWSWAPNFDPGSPYAARDYFSVNPWLADDGTGARAMTLFKDVVSAAEGMGLDVLIDMALNHAGRDVCFGQGAVDLGLCPPQQAGDWIREVRPSWCTRGTEFGDGYIVPHYREPAFDGYSPAIWAPADRLNEHTWYDANVDWFFGDYSSLGPKPGRVFDPRGNAEDESDLFYTDLSQANATADLWRYFAHVVPYWLDRTDGKLAGIRADFAQGLPNRLWEYVINVARNRRWDFVFLAEVLDPSTIQYRLNKVMDLLTTVWHGKFRDSNVTMPELFGILEGEASLFGSQAVVLHNGTSHDESGNPDKWCMVARYAVAAAVYGVPMVYMSQPLGIAEKLDFQNQFSNLYEAWSRRDPEREPVAAMYRRINSARDTSPELRGVARYFLNLQGGGFHDRIFSVARWVSAGATDSVVLAFVNLSTSSATAGKFGVPRSIRLAGNYNVTNLVADDPTASLWTSARSAEDLHENGIFVQFSYPNEVQYLRLTEA